MLTEHVLRCQSIGVLFVSAVLRIERRPFSAKLEGTKLVAIHLQRSWQRGTAWPTATIAAAGSFSSCSRSRGLSAFWAFALCSRHAPEPRCLASLPRVGRQRLQSHRLS